MKNINILLAEHQVFETDRLILRKVELTDATDIFEYCSNPEVVKSLTISPHETIDVSKDGIVNYFMSNRLTSWAIVDKESQKMIGTIDMRITGSQASFGWVLNDKFWGKGLMPEAAKCLRDFAFDVLNFQVLTADHMSENVKSGRVMEKIGMKKTGQIYLYMNKLKKSVLCDYYALTKEEYDEIKNK